MAIVIGQEKKKEIKLLGRKKRIYHNLQTV